MPGWNLKNGLETKQSVSDDEIGSLFNFVFSDASKKNTYKFGLIKSLLDSLLYGKKTKDGLDVEVEKGMDYARFLDAQIKLMKKTNRVRKRMKLQNN